MMRRHTKKNILCWYLFLLLDCLYREPSLTRRLSSLSKFFTPSKSRCNSANFCWCSYKCPTITYDLINNIEMTLTAP